MAVNTIIERQEIGVSVGSSTFQLPVYALGYAPRGPENEDIYFANYADFKRKFGSTPYYFKNTQYKDLKFFQAQGTPEKGFIFAHEYALTNAPGVFRRVTKQHAPYCELEGGLKIMTKVYKGTREETGYQASLGNIDFVKTQSQGTVGTYEGTVYKYEATCQALIDEQLGATTFQHTTTVDEDEVTTNERLFSVAIGGKEYWSNEETTSEEMGDRVWQLGVSDTGKITLLTNEDNEATDGIVSGVVSFESRFSSLVAELDAFGIKVVIDGTTRENVESQVNGTSILLALPIGDITLTLAEAQPRETGKTMAIKASSSGIWGSNIQISVERVQNTNKVNIRASYNNGEEQEAILGDLVYGSDNFIAGKTGVKTTRLLKIENQGLNGTEDSSLIYVEPISLATLKYLGNPNEDEVTVEDIYAVLKNKDYWQGLVDKDLNDYAIHTTSGYPLHDPTDVDSNASEQLQTIANYQLGVALIDTRQRPVGQSILAEVETLLNSTDKPLEDVVSGVNSTGEHNDIYGAMFFDWRAYDTSFGRVELPPSFAYVKALASTGIEANRTKAWEALANDNGQVSVSDDARLGGIASDMLQRNNSAVGIRINPIQYLKDVGNRIMGNSTLANNQGELTNYSFLNIRILTTIIKRFAYKLGNTLKYKTNDLNTFLNFQSKMTEFMNKLLDKGLKTEDNRGRRIVPFGIDRLPSTERGQIRINIWYYPQDAIEKIETSITLKAGYVSVGG